MRRRQNERHSRLSRRAVLAGIASVAVAPATAQTGYPNRVVKIIVPTAAGAAIDTVARGLAARLEAHYRTPFVVENKPGANATIGSQFVATAEPDGYTLLYTGQAITVNPSLYATPYDPERSFAPIATVATAPITLVVPPNSPFKDVRALIDAAKRKRGGLAYGSAGRGSPPYLAAVLFQQKADVEFTHIPYKGAAPALADVLGERLDLMFPSLSLAQGFFATGQLRVLGIASETRSPLAPDIPTIQEMGLPGYATSSWSGLVAPAGTPADVLTSLEGAVETVLNAPDMKTFFTSQGLDPNFRGRRAFAALIQDEIKNWSRMLANTNSQ